MQAPTSWWTPLATISELRISAQLRAWSPSPQSLGSSRYRPARARTVGPRCLTEQSMCQDSRRLVGYHAGLIVARVTNGGGDSIVWKWVRAGDSYILGRTCCSWRVKFTIPGRIYFQVEIERAVFLVRTHCISSRDGRRFVLV